MKKLLSVIALAMFAFSGWAQEINTADTEAAEETSVAADEIAAMKPVAIDGVFFQVPDVCIVQKTGGTTIAKYPDGSFGVSAEVEKSRASENECLEICRATARNYKLKDVSSKKVNINGQKGAMATGKLESQQVTVLVLSGKKGRLSMVVMNSAGRMEMAKAAVQSIRGLN